jgi:hypothetical protein
MSIRQFNAGYQPDEDRILLRVTLAGDEEFRFWLTRACLRGFFRQIDAWLRPDDASASAAIQAFQREAGVARADFRTPLKPGERFPLGETPLLVKSIAIDAADKVVHVTFRLAGNQQANFNINDEILASVHAMLKQAVVAADWGLAVEAMPVVGSAPARLH